MKKRPIFALLVSMLLVCLSPAFAQREDDPGAVLHAMLAANGAYVAGDINGAVIGADRREYTAANGQQPYAVVIACSDSRVPVEHLFHAGIGDVFVVRTAGNVIGDFELGSIEYGAEHLGASVVMVLGHSSCGAVSATLGGHADGKIRSITDEIALGIGGETDAALAEALNVCHSVDRILESETIQRLVEAGDILVVPAMYDLQSGAVTLL